MTSTSIEDILAATSTSNSWHLFSVEGGAIQLTTEQLRSVLGEFCSPADPNWVNLITESDFEGL